MPTYAPRQSTAVRTAKQQSVETTIGASPVARGFNALPSAAMTDADPGTLVANGTLPADWASVSGGVLSKNGTWTMTGVAPGGYLRSLRIKDSTGATNHWDMLVSEPYAGGKTYVAGMNIHNNGNVYAVVTGGAAPAPGTTSGAGTAAWLDTAGPTGTTDGIVVGGVTVNYIGKVQATIDNSNVATGQTVTINTFTNTDGNA